MSEEGGAKTASAATDETIPASNAPPEPRSSVPTIPPPPDARYRLGDELGRGGMGRVVEAYDTHLGRTVALKEVLPKAGNIERRFQREVRITARLEHASIVPLYDSGRLADGRPFYVMRRVSGRPLDEAIARARSLENRLALLPNALAAIDAIAHAHRRGVVHRDLKPQNILVGELGETVVIDWGLAKVIGDSDEPVHDSLEPRVPSAADSLQTQAGSVFGTPGFMPPEQARGDDLGPPADVYALGATLYQVIAGKPPFGGTSATDVISSTLRHRMDPIAKAAPGAPPELVTIIEKALAFEPTDRYADAGELAEDVRRFLTGQLVAAHRYTRRQRVVRFARRHRAPLIVAALASVGIAALAWISVHRILQERDTAQSASIEAERQRDISEQRAAEIRERADQLLLLYARSLLDTNPTHAFGVLKQVEATAGPVRDETAAIARAAVMRGVAWGLPTLPELTVSCEMTSDGKRLLQVTRAGMLQVLDLELRKSVATHEVPVGVTGMWIEQGRKILLDGYRMPPSILDPVTGSMEPLAVDEIHDASRTADGARIAARDGTRELVIIDAASRQVTRVPGRSGVENVLMAPDGAWIAVSERYGDKLAKQRAVVVDPAGRVLWQRDGEAVTFGASAGGKLAISFRDGIVEVTSLLAKPVVAAVPPAALDARFIHTLRYRGEKLYIATHDALYVWSNGEVRRAHHFPEGAMNMTELAGGVLAVSSSDGRITLLDGELTHAVQVTSRPPGIVRVAAAPSSSRLVATASDALLVWDIRTFMPRRIPSVNTPLFASETLVVSGSPLMPDWERVDVTTGTKHAAPFTAPPGLPRGVDVALDDARVMLLVERSPTTSSAIVGYPDGNQIVIDNVAHGLARLVEGGAVVYSPGRGIVLGRVGDESARELVKLDGDVVAVAPLGRLGYAAASLQGELVRGGFDGTQFMRTSIAGITDRAFLESEHDGGVLLALGNRLVRWPRASRATEDVARFKSAITWLHASTHGVMIGLQGGEVMFMPASGDRTPRRMPISHQFTFARDGSRVVSLNGRNELEVLELPSMVSWTIPRMTMPSLIMSMSPTGRHLLQQLGVQAALYTMVEPGSDFPAWLDEITNASDVDRHVHWPWQPGTP